MKQQKLLIVIGGATATGKTELAIAVSRHFHAEILSADSRQFYREMNIGTAKPTAAELAAVPHHFINSLSIHEDFTAGDFERDAMMLLEQIFQKKDVAVLVGGSGLFIRALCEGLDRFPPVPEHIRRELEAVFQINGIASLQQELLEKDPVYYQRVDLSNPQRLIRALEVCRASGKPFSTFQAGGKSERPFIPVYVLLQMKRTLLYEKINRRVDWMMKNGLLEEAEKLFPQRSLNALQTVGYQELFEYLEGKMSLQDAVLQIKQNTRRYAKRQETWFRKDPHWRAFSPTGTAEILRYLEEKIASFRTNPPNSS